MKLFVFVLFGMTTAAGTAMAMPDFDGTYMCTTSINSSIGQLTLVTRDNKLYMEGPGVPADQGGLPCENTNGTQAVNGLTSSTATTCTDRELTNKVSIKYDGENTDLTTSIRITKASAREVAMEIIVSGVEKGNSLQTRVTMDCKK